MYTILVLSVMISAALAGESSWCSCPEALYASPPYFQAALDEEQGLQYDCETSEPPMTPGVQNAITNTFYHWPNGKVYYVIRAGDYTASQVTKIENAIAEMNAISPGCFEILQRQNEQNYIEIFKGSGCWSYIGKIGNKQSLSLYHSTGGTCLVNGIIQHEIMHAVGFYHEQSRMDRDDHICVNYTNIQSSASGNFKKSSSMYLNSDYQYGSVMHYGSKSFAVDRAFRTIIPCNTTASIGQRSGLSEADKDRLRALYPCP